MYSINLNEWISFIFLKEKHHLTYREIQLGGEKPSWVDFCCIRQNFPCDNGSLVKTLVAPLLLLRVGGQSCDVLFTIGCFGVDVGVSVGLRNFPSSSRLLHCYCSPLWSSRVEWSLLSVVFCVTMEFLIYVELLETWYWHFGCRVFCFAHMCWVFVLAALLLKQISILYCWILWSNMFQASL